MAKYPGKKPISEVTRREARKLSRGRQSPEQTQAQSQLVAQGIERGPDPFKTQWEEAARTLGRRRRELPRRATHPPETGEDGAREGKSATTRGTAVASPATACADLEGLAHSGSWNAVSPHPELAARAAVVSPHPTKE